MKKVIYFLIVITLSFFPLLSSAANTEKPSTDVTKPPEAETKALLKNFEGVSKVDKSTLVANEKKNSQVVVRSTERHRHSGGVIYISAGTLIIILLIILLV
jgi:hypothetical protein